MKTTKVITMSCIILMSVYAKAQTSDEREIHRTITTFAKAGDEHDVETLDAVLDDHYRIVMNRLFGSKAVAIVPKSVYLEKIASKEWGGDAREVTFEAVTINGPTAFAKVILKGKKATFISLISLIKTEQESWKMISDTPTIE